MDKKVIVKVLTYIRNYRLILFFSLLLALVSVAATLYIPILIGSGVDCIVGKGAVDFERVRMILIRGAIITLVGALAQWLMGICNNKIAYGVIRDIRREAFSHIQVLPLSYLDAHSPGDLVSRVIADVDQFADGLLMGFTQFFTGVATILGTLIFMLTLNPVITLLVVVLTPLSFLVARFITTHTHDMFRLQSVTRGEQTGLIEECLGNQKVVKAYSQEKDMQDKFDEINLRLRDCAQKAVFYSSLTNPCTRFVNSMVYALVGIFGAFAAVQGRISVGRLTSFLSYANQYTKPFNEISGVITELQNALTCAGRVFDFIESAPQTPDPEDAGVLETVDPDSKEVTLEHVNFGYTPDQKLIKDFNLNVKPGQRIAIVGPTGCGKTTVINLLMRFYDVRGGKITVDGTDIREVTRESLRKSYGMVLQETWLKSGTIYENLTMGKPDASREEVIAAAKQAHAHSFIRKLKDGYDTVIGEDGGSLSAGQKQLLCIARVMLTLPPMLILDEATSSIDTRTEQKIQNAFAGMMKGRTSFIVAHRLSTIQNADIILVMKDGDIIEQGNHEQLLSRDGFYASLYRSQFQPT